MTTIPLSEALDRAKPGTLKSREHNRAVLKHCRNELPGLVEAVKTWMNASEAYRDRVDDNTTECLDCAHRTLEAALQSAQNVKMP